MCYTVICCYTNNEFAKCPCSYEVNLLYSHMHTQDIDGKMCIICPKHKYKITLADGEGLYKATNPREQPPVARWYSKGVRQRTHTVTESNGEVYVKLSEDKCYIDSDFFQGEKGKLERKKYEEDSPWWQLDCSLWSLIIKYGIISIFKY